MSAATVQEKPTIQTLEIAIVEAREVRCTWDADAGHEFIEATIPSLKTGERYTLRGHAHGRDATCSCWGFTRHKRCKHTAQFLLVLEELSRQHYADPSYTTKGVLSPEQRLRRGGIRAALRDRGISHEATRTLAEQVEVVRRGKAAKSELFGD